MSTRLIKDLIRLWWDVTKLDRPLIADLITKYGGTPPSPEDR